MTTTLSKELQQKIVEAFENDPKVEIYWDYRETISNNSIKEILEKGFNDFENELIELNSGYIFDLEDEKIKSILSDFEEELEAEGFSLENDMSELRDMFIEYIEVDMNIPDLLRNTYAIARVELMSNYDCLNSNWYEQQSGGYGFQEHYFSDVIKALNINPKELKKHFVENDIRFYGNAVDYSKRNDKVLIDYKELISELDNNCCGATLLTFAIKLDMSDLYKSGLMYENGIDKIKQIKLYKGTRIGFYSSFQGGGSPFDMELQRDTIINLNFDDKYFGFRLVSDDKGYSMQDCYGVSEDFFEEATILEDNKMRRLLKVF
jgi:hypothetical protein